MARFLLSIPEHLTLSIFQKVQEDSFQKLTYSCKAVNDLIEKNLKNFKIHVPVIFNVGLLDRELWRQPAPRNHDAKLVVYLRTPRETYSITGKSFELSYFSEELPRFSWVKFGMIKFGTVLSLPDWMYCFTPQQIRDVLECFHQNQMTCLCLEMYTFVGAEQALRVLKPKVLCIDMPRGKTPEMPITGELLSLLETCVFTGHFDFSYFREYAHNCKNLRLIIEGKDLKSELKGFFKKIIHNQIAIRKLHLNVTKDFITGNTLISILSKFSGCVSVTEKENTIPITLIIVPRNGTKDFLCVVAKDKDAKDWAEVLCTVMDSWERVDETFWGLDSIARDTNVETVFKEKNLAKMEILLGKRKTTVLKL